MIGAAFRFCAVGVLVAALDFGTLWLFKSFMPRLWAVSLAYFIGVATHFCLNKWWVFASRRQLHAAELARYVLMVIACWLCTVAVAWAALKFLTPNVLVAKLIAVAPVAALAFVMMRRFVFRP
jgi:putative flippase GtrA